MTETIHLVDRFKFIEKDLPSSGSVIVQGWMKSRRVREELALTIQNGGCMTTQHHKEKLC